MCVAEYSQFRVAPRVKAYMLQGFGRPRCCCENTHVCPRVNKHRVACKDLGQEIRGLVAAVHTHVCVAEYVNSGLHKDQGFWPTRCCCEHTHMCVSEKTPSQFKLAHQKQEVTRAMASQPTNCCCKHTHVRAGRITCQLQGLHRGSNGLQEVGPPVAAASTHICVLQKKKGLNPRTKGCQECGKPSAAHTCAFQKNSSRLHPRVKGYTGLADQLLLRAYTCVLQDISIQGCTCKPVSVKGYNGLADQLLPREHTCDMCVAEKTNSGLVWPTTS